MNYFKSRKRANVMTAYTGPVLILVLLFAFAFTDANLSSVDYVPGAETVVEFVTAETVQSDALDGVATVAVVDDCLPYMGTDHFQIDYPGESIVPGDGCGCPGWMGTCDCNGCTDFEE